MKTKFLFICYSVLIISLTVLLGKLFIQERSITAQLQEVRTYLDKIHHEATKPTEKVDLTAINQDIRTLAALVKGLKPQDENAINQLLLENRTSLDDKLDSIQKVIKSLDDKQHPVKYLPLTALPFTLVSIDSIQQISVVTVTYDYKYIPLEKGDTLAGWTVTHLDFSKQQAEFINDKEEHVQVALAQAQGEQDA
ncbi:hypothetical protein Lsan_3889 [Legionella santicrucis]|uniref:Uncharacterized protein n=1 Tax=Legionella santicrucis TaxID=45074 RepID=A0A0W0Y965_9GAMM|nr:hypothetical protein [Legionella santicrucis]KTD53479.1 hypothetical protein Lsan_3889 [Legionella santicrucis]